MDDKSEKEIGQYLKQVDLKEALMVEIKSINSELCPLFIQLNFPVLYTWIRVEDFVHRFNLRALERFQRAKMA